MSDSIFTKIIKGEVPAHKIYEDDRTLAFLDIDPLTPGHTVVAPKQQVGDIWDADDELYKYLMKIVRKVAHRLRDVLNPKRVGMAVDGFGIPDHLHVHVFALEKGLPATFRDQQDRKNRHEEPDLAALAEMAEKLRFEK